ncbi:septal ring lytic transglycosylase RlpA family protein [Methylobacterium sp. E-066]|uniref:septal ring lytic transglycosylase RlpA family protein n=1 Tax=Methylobacterium sp. E-066 TaxID=2836584 RepID=UPI001FB9B424|nr:septal ring lytic transglycosylase RlpA family protein [Methylobacterium sp. E-066]MCJ2139940.1 septal ring lytic transglycosylase RlpA family protein [Methylobacterium sp. E-066]
MIGPGGENRRSVARVLILASILSVPVAEARADPSPGMESRSGLEQVNVLKREAPVFTYRQFTTQLPSLSSSLEDTDPPEASSFSLPAQPTFPASVHPAGQEQAGLMGRFGQTVDPVSAQDGLAGARSEPSSAEPSSAEPSTTAAVAEQPAPPDPQTGHDAATAKPKLLGSGRASWYKHSGRTASGETYDPNKLTAAHHTLPFGTKVKVVNTRNGRSVIVQITDRTNEHTKAKRNYMIDLSRASAQKLGIEGIGRVALYQVD